MSDFAKLQRNIVEQFEGDSDLLGIYCFILAKMTWGDFVFNLKRKSHQALPGQYITTLKSLQKNLGKDRLRILRELRVLIEMGVFTLEYRGKQCLVITNTNEVKKNAIESASIIPSARISKRGNCTLSNDSENVQIHTFKEGNCTLSGSPKDAIAHFQGLPSSIQKKKIIEQKKEKMTLLSLKFDPLDLEIAKLWLAYAIREMSWTKPPSSWTEENFAKEIGKIRKVMNLNQEGFLTLLNYVENDAFWITNALSPANLLQKSKNGLRKIENILKGMKTPQMRQTEKIERWKDEPGREPLFNF